MVYFLGSYVHTSDQKTLKRWILRPFNQWLKMRTEFRAFATATLFPQVFAVYFILWLVICFCLNLLAFIIPYTLLPSLSCPLPSPPFSFIGLLPSSSVTINPFIICNPEPIHPVSCSFIYVKPQLLLFSTFYLKFFIQTFIFISALLPFLRCFTFQPNQ